MRTITRSVLCFLLLVGTAAADTQLGVLAGDAIDAWQKITGIQTEMKEAVGQRADRQRSLSIAMHTLNEAPIDESKLERLDERIASEEAQLAEMAEHAMDDALLQRRRAVIDELKLQRQAGQISDPAAQDAFRSELQGPLDELTAEINQIQAPFNEQIREIRSDVDQRNSALSEALQAYFKTPGGQFEGVEVAHLNASMNTAFAGLEWAGPDGEQVAWAHVRIRPTSEVTDHDRQRLFDDQHPIRVSGKDNMWVWAGNFLVTFVAVREDLKGEAKIQEVIQDFIDLDGLAQVEVPSSSTMAEVTE